jgi:hypothetical protein
MEMINLENRIAKCTCGREAPSNENLAFFEFRLDSRDDIVQDLPVRRPRAQACCQ